MDSDYSIKLSSAIDYCQPWTYSYYYTPNITAAQVREIVREELERVFSDDKSIRKAQIAALKRRLKELESA